VEVTPRNFGRIAAQTTKQAMMQRIRQVEEMIYRSSRIGLAESSAGQCGAGARMSFSILENLKPLCRSATRGRGRL
jgi:hypothetical protein